jgi:hypothetical protein
VLPEPESICGYWVRRVSSQGSTRNQPHCPDPSCVQDLRQPPAVDPAEVATPTGPEIRHWRRVRGDFGRQLRQHRPLGRRGVVVVVATDAGRIARYPWSSPARVPAVPSFEHGTPVIDERL